MLTKLLSGRPVFLTVFATIVSFCCYASMYALRKAYLAADFSDSPQIWDLTYKSVLVIVQVLGYALSKVIGVKIVSEMSSTRRAWALTGLVSVAALALVGFALVPAPFNWPFMFLNGLPLGMVWGIVFSYLEGRQQTEVMGLGLCASFIFASGFVKDVGRWLMAKGISEFWMPLAVAGIFLLPLLVCIWLLNQVPPPSETDQRNRTVRVPMLARDRRRFFYKFAPGLLLLIIVYALLTAYRDFRDTFMAEFWIELRGPDHAVSFSQTETPVSISVLLLLMFLVLVKDNLKALLVNHVAIALGLLLTGVATWAFSEKIISDLWWMGLTGFGTYLAYIPFNSILFDRLIASVRTAANVGFLIYVADACGYVGSVGILLYKNIAEPELSWIEFFYGTGYLLAVAGGIGTAASAIYFWRTVRSRTIPET